MTGTRVHALALAIVAAGSLTHPAAAQPFPPKKNAAATASDAAQSRCETLAVQSRSSDREFVWKEPAAAGTVVASHKATQLELVSQRQGSPTRPQLRLAAVALPAAPLPGAAGCGRPVLRGSEHAGVRPGGSLGTGDFLGTKRLPVNRTPFDGAWHRVRNAALPPSSATAFTGISPGAPGKGLLAHVNAYANRRIRYVEDRALYGRADYWANAGATLARGAGDCEDIAIAKFQLLAAAGVPRRNMYLTIAHDPVRKGDHAVLIVRLGRRHWLLDNSNDRVVDAAGPLSYQPIFSFSTDGRWLHGY